MIKYNVRLVATCGVLHMLAARPEAAVLRVPSEYATINAALDASTSGDSVLVAPGVYDEYETRLIAGQFWFSCVGFLRDGVSLVSETGAGSTTLRMDTTTADPGLLLGWGGSGRTEVVGFTLTGSVPGLNAAGQGYGGTLIFRDCVLRDIGSGSSSENALGTVQAGLEVYGCRFENINGGSGGAINQTSSTLLVEDSEFVNCQALAVHLRYDPHWPFPTNAAVRRCRFVDNSYPTAGPAALGVFGYSTVEIEDCWFEGNEARSGAAIGAGGSESVIRIRGNTFVRNTALFTGGMRVGGASVQVLGNTFWENSSGLNSTYGGSCVFFVEGSGELRNNVIVGSTGDEAVGMFSGTVQTSCNVFWANPVGDAVFPLSATDLPADPLLCAPESQDFRVNSASPCLSGHGHPGCTELIGAWGEGCGTIGVAPFTWGRVKGQFRNESEGRK